MAPRSVLEALEEVFGADASSCAERLETLVGLWQRYGRVMNLTASLDKDALWEQVEEGLLGVKAIYHAGFLSKDWVDVGSGGGFPGLVFAACLTGSGCLVEPRLKRFEFLEIARTQLGLGDLDLCRARLSLGRGLGDRRWSVASARAVWSPKAWLEQSESLLRHEGLVLLHLPVATEVDSEVLDGGRWKVASSQTSDSWRVVALLRT